MIYGNMHKIFDFFYLIKLLISLMLRNKKTNNINLNYANANNSRDGFFRGGRVKLKILEKKYPQKENFNFLYLVSSALPNYVNIYIYLAKLFKKIQFIITRLQSIILNCFIP